ncbi:hypothetical protein [Aminobacterium mobile]|jgi:Na+/proline symporter|uniref:hypothetical protein n=1 Tax=Aminobacterium mobile TaxID=81467 RepID=UPI000465ADE3|nr:hypothetical protein [Aminobacterium mobile]
MRITVLLLSLATIILFAYALAGLGGFFFGKGNTAYIIFGLSGGILSALAALWLWKKYLKSLENQHFE